MGKIRIKSLGIEEEEKEQAKDAKKRKEAKKTLRQTQGKKLAKGAHGGERVVSMGPTEEELEQLSVIDSQLSDAGESVDQSTGLPAGKTGKQKTDKQGTENRKARQRSKRYAQALVQVDRNRRYPLSEAVALVKKISETRFDATIELHINTIEKGISGKANLPHGSGKKVRVAIANPETNGQFDTLVSAIEKGAIDFDILIATPSAMAKLAKVAKILGPRGLMPNPKNGTITEDPEKLAASFAKGQVTFKTESQAPIIHASVGKASFKEKDLEENIAAFLKAVDSHKIQSVSLKSTMSPAIKIEF